MTQQAQNVVEFPIRRARPGLRHMILDAENLIIRSQSNNEWQAEQEIEPQRLLNLVPDQAIIWKSHDAAVAARARQLAILAIYALQSGAWSAPVHLRFFMELQSAAVRVLELPAIKSAVAEALVTSKAAS